MTENKPMNFMRTETVNANEKLTEEVAMFSYLDKTLVENSEASNAKRYEKRPKSLGGGRVGHPMAPVYWERGCERALWYEFKMYPSESPFPAKLYRIFAMGHALEEIAAKELRAAGFTLLTEDENGKQFGFALAHNPETGHPRFKGFCDGVIIDGPAEVAGVRLRYPMLWENKAINNKKFNKFVEEGVERSHPNYYGQIQIYQNFLNLFQNPALLTVQNRETGEQRIEFIRFNQKHCQASIDRAARVVETKNALTLERAAKDYNKLPCKWCNHKNQCQKDEDARANSTVNPIATAPDWLNQK